MNGLAAVLTVFLSMPGIPAKEYRSPVSDIATCVTAALEAQAEITRYAILEQIPVEQVTFKAKCTRTIEASFK